MKVSLPLLGFSWQGLGFCKLGGCGCLGLSGLNLTEGKVGLSLSSIGSQVGGGGGSSRSWRPGAWSWSWLKIILKESKQLGFFQLRITS